MCEACESGMSKRLPELRRCVVRLLRIGNIRTKASAGVTCLKENWAQRVRAEGNNEHSVCVWGVRQGERILTLQALAI